MSEYKQEVETPTPLKISKFVSWFAYAWAMFGVVTLLLRTFLLATSASLNSGFGGFISRTSADYLQPFRGIFPPTEVSDTGYLDISALFAAATYLFLGWGLKELVVYVQGKIDRNRDAQQEYLLREAVKDSVNNIDDIEVRAKKRVVKNRRKR